VNYVEFSPDGKKYLAASDDNTMLILESETGQPYSKKIRCSSNIQTAKFNHTGNKIATGTSNSTVQIWDVETSMPLVPAMKHKNSIRSLEFKDDDTLLASSSTDHTTCVWDTQTGDAICPPMPHSYIVENSFFIAGDCILTSCGDRMIRKWQLHPRPQSATNTKTETINTTFALSSNGSLLITGGTDGIVRISETKSHRPEPLLIDHGVEIKCLAVSADHKMLAVGDSKSSTTIHHVHSPEPPLAATNAPVPSTNGAAVKLRDEANTALLSLQFSPDGTKLLVVRDGTAAYVFETLTGDLLYTLRQSRSILSAVFSTDGTHILSSSKDGTAILWDAETGASTGIEVVHTDYVDACALSPNGNFIATGSRDHSARVLNVQTGEPVGPPLQHHGGIVSIVFAPDGKSVATGCRDGFARIWHLNQLDTPVTMQAGLGRVFVKYTPDGKILLTANEEQIRLWDPVDGKSLGTILQHRSALTQFEVAPDSKSVIACDERGQITTWILPSVDMSPIHELENKVELVTGYRADFRTGLEILTPRELSSLIEQAADTP
ncbi:WD40 repeat domain-containing protein, partial [bacterium]|nr:WD40 repeat domain-containing protein [bacterium]